VEEIFTSKALVGMNSVPKAEYYDILVHQVLQKAEGLPAGGEMSGKQQAALTLGLCKVRDLADNRKFTLPQSNYEDGAGPAKAVYGPNALVGASPLILLDRKDGVQEIGPGLMAYPRQSKEPLCQCSAKKSYIR